MSSFIDSNVQVILIDDDPHLRQALCQPMAKLGADGVGHGDSDRGQRVQAAETVCCRRRARRSHSFSCR